MTNIQELKELLRFAYNELGIWVPISWWLNRCKWCSKLDTENHNDDCEARAWEKRVKQILNEEQNESN